MVNVHSNTFKCSLTELNRVSGRNRCYMVTHLGLRLQVQSVWNVSSLFALGVINLFSLLLFSSPLHRHIIMATSSSSTAELPPLCCHLQGPLSPLPSLELLSYNLWWTKQSKRYSPCSFQCWRLKSKRWWQKRPSLAGLQWHQHEYPGLIISG